MSPSTAEGPTTSTPRPRTAVGWRRRPHSPDWSLRRRLARTYVIIGVIVVLLALLAIVTLGRTTIRIDDVVNRLSPAAITTAQLEIAYVDQETGVRGYALAKQDDFLQPYRTGQRAEAAAIRRLHSLLDGDPKLLADLAQAEAQADRWHRTVAEPIIDRTRVGGGVTLAELEASKTNFDSIRSTLSDLRQDIAAERGDALMRLHRAVIFLEVVVGLALAGVVLIGIGLWQAQRRWVLEPLRAVGVEVGQVADGDLGHPITVTGSREFADLARDVEGMRETIVSLYEEAVRAQEEVAAQAQILTDQATELRRSNVELEQFAYVASHDLQEPLRKVASFCQMLERRYKGQLDDRADQYIAFAVDGAKRMQRLINDLLAFSRVGRTESEFTDVDLDAAVEQAASNLASTIEETGADVTARDLPVVHGDRTLLTQLLQNLIGNGIKFRGEEPPRVVISADRDGDEWVFACADNGIGIEPEYAERVFVIFQRLHSKEAYEGTGIGLAMCKKIVEYHGGRIWIDTGAGAGTTVKWTLPVSRSSR